MNQEQQIPPQPRLNYEPRARRAPVAVPVSLCLTLIICGTALILATILAVHWNRGDYWMTRALFAPVTWLPLGLGVVMIAAGYWHARH